MQNQGVLKCAAWPPIAEKTAQCVHYTHRTSTGLAHPLFSAPLARLTAGISVRSYVPQEQSTPIQPANLNVRLGTPEKLPVHVSTPVNSVQALPSGSHPSAPVRLPQFLSSGSPAKLPMLPEAPARLPVHPKTPVKPAQLMPSGSAEKPHVRLGAPVKHPVQPSRPINPVQPVSSGSPVKLPVLPATQIRLPGAGSPVKLPVTSQRLPVHPANPMGSLKSLPSGSPAKTNVRLKTPVKHPVHPFKPIKPAQSLPSGSPAKPHVRLGAPVKHPVHLSPPIIPAQSLLSGSPEKLPVLPKAPTRLPMNPSAPVRPPQLLPSGSPAKLPVLPEAPARLPVHLSTLVKPTQTMSSGSPAKLPVLPVTSQRLPVNPSNSMGSLDSLPAPARPVQSFTPNKKPHSPAELYVRSGAPASLSSTEVLAKLPAGISVRPYVPNGASTPVVQPYVSPSCVQERSAQCILPVYQATLVVPSMFMSSGSTSKLPVRPSAVRGKVGPKPSFRAGFLAGSLVAQQMDKRGSTKLTQLPMRQDKQSGPEGPVKPLPVRPAISVTQLCSPAYRIRVGTGVSTSHLEPNRRIPSSNTFPFSGDLSMFTEVDKYKAMAFGLSQKLGEVQDELEIANKQIEKLKAANRTLAETKELQEKIRLRYIKQLEGKIHTCLSDHIDKKDAVQYMKQHITGLTPNQLSVLLQEKIKPHWTTDEIAMAFTIRYFSKRCYIHLRKSLFFPLPGISTLQNYAGRLNLRPSDGILLDVLRHMQTAGLGMSSREKECSMAFDEVSVRRTWEYDSKNDEIVGPHRHLQVVMIRGIFSQWKQIVFAAFDQRMTDSIIRKLIELLHKIGYNVRMIVSDNGAENVALRNALGVSLSQPFFPHPVTEKNVYCFGDAPHNLKLIRNWLVGGGFVWDGEKIDVSLIKKLLKERPDSELSSFYKITEAHIVLNSAEKQNVSKAAKLLSNTTATAIKTYYANTDDQKLADKLSSIIYKTDKWFDCSNSRPTMTSVPTKKPFEANAEQMAALKDMEQLMLEVRGVNNSGVIQKGLAIFQKSIVMSIRALIGLYFDLGDEYGDDSDFVISTYKLNTDPVESYFSHLRSKGGMDDRPTPLSAINRMKLIMLGKTPGMVQRNTNTVEDSGENERDEFLTAKVMRICEVEPDIPSPIQDEDLRIIRPNTVEAPVTEEAVKAPIVITAEQVLEAPVESTPEADLPKTWPAETFKNSQERDGFVHLMSHIAYIFRDRHDLGCYTAETDDEVPEFMKNLSYNRMKTPSMAFQLMGEEIERIFLACQGDNGFKVRQNAVKFVVSEVKKLHPDYHEEIVTKYIKMRTFIRMKHYNLHLDGKFDTADSRKRPNEDRGERARKKFKKLSSK